MPPPVVTFTSPSYTPYEVNNNTFSITANILNISGSQDIRFRVNGQTMTNFYFNNSNKTFQSNIVLNEGTNVVEIKATNNVGQDIEQVQLIYKKPVVIQPPVVSFVDPSVNPKNVTGPLYNVAAKALHVDYKYQVTVRVNGTNVQYFNFNPSTKIVTFQANLVPGSNMLEVAATNNDGSDQATTSLILAIPEQSPPPIVTIIEPNVNPFHTASPNGHVAATVLNVAGKSNIELKINSVSTTNFSYNSITKLMEINTPLVDGANVFSIVATNNAGTDNAGVTIIYDKPVQVLPPVISITVPSSNPHTTMIGSQIINADILNVPIATNVSANYNGNPTSGFSYDPNTGKFSYNAILIEGANILEITAFNSAGTASKSQTVIYVIEEEPCNNPAITLTSPSSNPFITSSNKGGTTANITGASSIIFKVDGVATTSYNYNAQTGAFKFLDNSLNEGANVYELIAINDCGTTNKVVTVLYEKKEQPCVEPSISLVVPSSYSTSTSAATMNFTFKISNLEDASGIQITNNGVACTFQFDPITGLVTGTASIAKGANNLLVKANNSCGGDIATIRIDRRGLGTGITFPPTVNIVDPGSNPYTTTQDNYAVLAKVTNVTAASEISVNVDGNSTPFSFDASNKTVKIPLQLAVGSQTLNIAVATANGADDDQVELIRTNPCTTPIVTIFRPGIGVHYVSSDVGTIGAHVQHSDEVSVTLNGNNYTNFTFDPATGKIIINYVIHNTDEYMFVVTGNHPDCGAANESVTIIFDGGSTDTPAADTCQTPTVNFTDPATSPYTSAISQLPINICNGACY